MSQEVLDFLQTVLIAFTICASLYQMYMSNKVAKIQVNQSLYARLADLNREMAENPDVNLMSDQSYDKTKKSPEQERGKMFVYRCLNLFDEVYYYKKNRMIEKSNWDSWKFTAIEFSKSPFFQSVWQSIRSEYELDFQELVDSAICEQSQD